MRSVVLTATLLTTFWLGLPGQVAAQEPDPPPTPAPAPAPSPPPPAREYAVPRSERVVVRDSETRSRDSEAPENRVPSRGVDRAPVREPEAARASSAGRASDAPRSDDEQRRGAVRRPPSGGSGGSGGSSGSDASDNSGRSRGSGRGTGDSGRGGNVGATVDRAVPRSSVPRPPDRVYVYPDYYRNYNRYYDPWGYGSFGLGYFYYSPWGWDPGYYNGYGYGSGYGYGYGSGGGYGAGYGYGRERYSAYGYDIGTLKLKVKPRDAEVYVDGYFAGYVDDFDGILQALKLDSGGHRVEIRKPGYETLHFDVRVQPERSITFRGELRPVP